MATWLPRVFTGQNRCLVDSINSIEVLHGVFVGIFMMLMFFFVFFFFVWVFEWLECFSCWFLIVC